MCGDENGFQNPKKDAPGLLWVPIQETVKKFRSSSTPSPLRIDFAKMATIRLNVAYSIKIVPNICRTTRIALSLIPIKETVAKASSEKISV